MDPTNEPSAESTGPDDSSTSAAERVVARFGGIRPMARTLDAPVTTVQGWKRRGHIPLQHHDEIRAAAQSNGIVLDLDELAAAGAPLTRAADDGRSAADRSADRRADDVLAGDVLAGDELTGEEPAARTAGDMSRKAAPERASVGAADQGDSPAGSQESEAPVVMEAVEERSGGSGLAWFAVVVALVALVGVLTAPWWRGPIIDDPISSVLGAPPDSGVSERIAALEASIGDGDGPDAGDLEERLQALEASIGDGEGLDAGDVEERLQALEANAVGAGGADTGWPETIETRIQALEDGGSPDAEALRASVDEMAAKVAQTADRVAQIEGVETITRDELMTELATISGQVAALQTLVAGIDTVVPRIEALETAQAADRILRETMTDLSDRLTRSIELSSTQISGVSGDVGVVADGLGALSARVEDVASGLEAVRASDSASQALMLMVGQLREAVATGEPLNPVLLPMASLFGSDPEVGQRLSTLEAYGETGVPTLAELRRDYVDMVRSAQGAARLGESPDWVDHALSSVQGLVHVRRTDGGGDGEDAGSTLSRAEQRLSDGDLAGARDAVAALEGPPAEAAADWLGKAEAKLAADAAVSDLAAVAIGRLAGGAAEATAQ